MRIASHCRITPNRCLANGQPVPVQRSERPYLTDLYHSLSMGYPKFFKMDNLCKAGVLAAELVLRGSSVDGLTPRHDVAVVGLNSSSSLDADLQHLQHLHPDSYFPSPAVFVYTLANIVTGEIAIRHKILGESSFYVIPEFSAHQMAKVIATTLSDANINCLLCGWIEVLGQELDVLMMLIDRLNGPAPTAQNINSLYNER
ncbi:MAG: hypothetical protein IJU72_06155 [Bacteroidales bacterium]|nr:hypothetical protein [Bacteroidales bacterium]